MSSESLGRTAPTQPLDPVRLAMMIARATPGASMGDASGSGSAAEQSRFSFLYGVALGGCFIAIVIAAVMR